MFYKLIDENTIEKVSNPIIANRKHIFTNSEEVFNENGYYKIEKAEYPQDEKYYESKYVLEDNVIRQVWVEVEIEEFIEEEYQEVLKEQEKDILARE